MTKMPTKICTVRITALHFAGTSGLKPPNYPTTSSPSCQNPHPNSPSPPEGPHSSATLPGKSKHPPLKPATN